ncbi:hypothetical protein [Haloarcula sp. JP-L23]|uniref:hypothetical protein n=1 Tax=Haloarcula sp. JP-L23 TaxID=2716717 RepID=UPI00140EAEEF|nr:hypothetical protein G9465_23780 [Haloarcula sp. JP-L23]
MADQQEAQLESSTVSEDQPDDESSATQSWIHDRLQASTPHEQLAGEFVKGSLELGTGCAIGAIIVVPAFLIASGGTVPAVELLGGGIIPLGVAAYHKRLACRLGDGSDAD